MIATMTPPTAHSPSKTARVESPSRGTMMIADTSRTQPTWTTDGEVNAAGPWEVAARIRSAARATAMNSSQVSVPPDDPTMT